jgi:hypothetical protein
MVAELYDALVAAGTPDDKARKAAEAMAGFDAYGQRLDKIAADVSDLKRDVGDLKRDVFVMKWMLGFVLAFQIAIFIKLFMH